MCPSNLMTQGAAGDPRALIGTARKVGDALCELLGRLRIAKLHRAYRATSIKKVYVCVDETRDEHATVRLYDLGVSPDQTIDLGSRSDCNNIFAPYRDSLCP
jgi:hypothetical protein